MGYITHHAIIVSSWDEESIQVSHVKAQEIFSGIAPVTPMTPPTMNGERSFMVAPDGSKEGWPDSDAGDAARTQFLLWLERNPDERPYCSWVEVEFGGDEPGRMSLRGPLGEARVHFQLDPA